MFNFKKTEDETTDLENEITRLISTMGDHLPSSNEYKAMSDNLKTLMEARELEDKVESRNTLSKETVATVAANLAGILLILNYERAHVLTSKALTNIVRFKI